RDAGAVILEVEHDRVLARCQRLVACPAGIEEHEQVVGEHRLAVEQVEAEAAPAPALGDDHPVAAALWNVDLGGAPSASVTNSLRRAAWGAGRHNRVLAGGARRA